MKAKVIREPYRMANLKIGDIVEIVPGMETDAEGIWNVPAGKLVLCRKQDNTFSYVSMVDLEIVEYDTIDWTSFRREAAKNILASMASWNTDHTVQQDVKLAINYADELIKQLKEDEK